MKITIDLDDPLLTKAKQLASNRRQTLRTVVEHAIRLALRESENEKEKFELKDARVNGGGLSSEFKSASWSDIREPTYTGRDR